MTRVLLVTHLDPVIHGQAMMAKQLKEGAEQWKDVTFYSLNTAYATTREELGKASYSKYLKLFQYKKKIIKIIRSHKIDTVIVTPSFLLGPFFKDAWIIRAIKKYSSAQIIGWVHMDPHRLKFEQRPALLKKWIRSTVSLVDLWVGCGKSLVHDWPAFIQGEKIAISNGIEALGEVHRKCADSDRALIVTYLSAMDEEKGWKELFAVAKRICEKKENVCFKFYGGVASDSLEEVHKVFTSHHYQKQIQWLGSVDAQQKKVVLKESDIFVFPSHTEQFPITVLEAMSASLPIVATNVGSLKDALPDQQLLEVLDLNSLQSQIEGLMESKEERLAQGKSNYERYNTLFSKNKFLENWHQLLLNK